jgi:hypothetical protein
MRPFPFDARRYYYYDVGAAGRRRAAAVGGSFSPLSLSPYLWSDPSDLSTLFQERTGASATTPSVVDGVVGSMRDKGSAAVWWTAPSDAARPILRNSGVLYWLEFDGGDDGLSTTVAVSQPFDRVSAWLLGATSDFFLIGEPGGGSNASLYQRSGELRIYSGTELTGLAAPSADTDFVATDRHNGASSRVAIDNGTYQTGNAGANAAAVLTIGGVDGVFADALFYGLVQKGVFTDPEIALLRTYLAAKQGRVL